MIKHIINQWNEVQEELYNAGFYICYSVAGVHCIHFTYESETESVEAPLSQCDTDH